MVSQGQKMVRCTHCKAALEVPHYEIGNTIFCPCCGLATVLAYEAGSIQNTEYFTTYREFIRLLSDEYDRKTVQPLLEKWFECQLLIEDAVPQLKNAKGEYLVLPFVHQAIQNDPIKRVDLYQKKMSLWR